MALVLCTGVDLALATTRKLILQQAGHKVVTAMDEPSVKAACRQYAFDVAVIGQTVMPKTKRHLMTLIREHCSSAKVLELYQTSSGKTLEDADSWLQVPADMPEELAKRVTALATKARSSLP